MVYMIIERYFNTLVEEEIVENVLIIRSLNKFITIDGLLFIQEVTAKLLKNK